MRKEVQTLIEDLKIKNLKKIKDKIKEIKKRKFKEINLAIFGEPLQTQRPRTGKFHNIYVPNAAKNKKFIRNQIKEQINLDDFEIISGEIKIYVDFFASIPKNFSKTDFVLSEMKYIRPTTTPDIDNLLKTYMDAITSLLWLDDGQIIETRTRKFYSVNPRVEIKIYYSNEIFNSVLKKYAKDKLENYKLNNT